MNDMGNIESSYFRTDEPTEQKQERNAEKAMVNGGRDLLLNLLERWDEKVEFYDSIDSIPPEVRADEKKFMLTVSVNDLTKKNLLAELAYLESLKEMYLD